MHNSQGIRFINHLSLYHGIYILKVTIMILNTQIE